MTWGTDLLPPNKSPFEAAVEETNSARYPLPTELITAVWSPDDCPVDLLPYLAWGLSVDIWDNDWPELKKRQVCRDALKLHRLKTTLAGVKEHVALTGASVLRAIRPPATGFLKGALTEEARLAWMQKLPQVRVYPYVTGAIARRRMFANGKGVTKQFHNRRPLRVVELPVVDEDGNHLTGIDSEAIVTDEALRVHAFMRATRGRDLYGRRATFYDNGAETPVTLSGDDIDVVTRVFLRSEPKHRQWHGRGFEGLGFLTHTDAELDVVSITAIRGAHAFPVTRGMEPIDVRPERVAQRRIAPEPRSFYGRFRRGRFLLPTQAQRYIYDRIALYDETKFPAMRKVRNWHGHGRFGIADFTSELRVRVPMRRNRRMSGAWHGVGFRKQVDMSPLTKAIQAVRVSKAFRDTVMIDTTTMLPAQFDSGLRFGEFDFGQILEVE